MNPVALLVGRPPGIVGSIAGHFECIPMCWLDGPIRREPIGEIASRRPDMSDRLKDRASVPVVRHVADAMVLAESEAS